MGFSPCGSLSCYPRWGGGLEMADIRNSQIMPRIPLLIAVCLVVMPAHAKYGGSGMAGSAATSTYVFVPDQSTVVQTGGIAYVHRTYSIEGQFDLTVDPNAGTASFAHVDANATDDSPFKRTLDPNHVFNMASLVGTVVDDATVKFTGKASDGSDILITLTIQDDLAHLIGQTTPPPNSADFFIFSLDTVAQRKYGGGSGTADDPYQIATAADLIALGETPEDYAKHFILTRDIDLDPNLPDGKVFTGAVIAPDTNPNDRYSDFQGTSFTGFFDGNKHTVSHLTIKGGGYLGLFGYLGPGAEVRNLALVDVNITGSDIVVGGLLGYNGSGTLSNCYSTGVVKGSSSVGGLAGSNAGVANVTYCYSTATISGRSFVGGLVGSNGATVTHCYSAGAVDGDWLVGGLVGFGFGTVLHSVWDIETSGLLGSAGGVGLTSAEMMDPCMLGLNGFANDPNWVLDGGHDYPRLAWERTPGQIIPEADVGRLEGQGTPASPYRIDTADQLILLGKASILWDKYFVLGADIDLHPNLPGGHLFRQSVFQIFRGVFDGNGHTISHLTVYGEGYLGLFGRLESGAEVRNLGVADVNVTDSGYNGYVGGLVGYSSATVSNCYSTGTIKGSERVGGLVGYNYGSVSTSYSTVMVSGSGSCVAGLVGGNSGTVTQCYSSGPVRGGGAYVGGLVEYTAERAHVTDCFWDIQTSGQATSAGGTGKTKAEMQTAKTFIGWAHEPGVWTIDEGKDYPRLSWENAPGEPIVRTHYYGGGTGTQADPYLLYTSEELNMIGLIARDWDKHFKLMADIDLSGLDGKAGRLVFTVIATDYADAFTGVFDGNGHIISHLTVTGGSYLGLFGKLESGAVVRNLALVDLNVAGSGDYIGGLAGQSAGQVTNCCATGSVSGKDYVGGLVGFNGGVVSQCYSSGTVNGSCYVGGLAGWNTGWNKGTVTHCYSTSTVNGKWGVGGLVGENYAAITRCYSTGKVSGTAEYIGGLVGYGRPGVANCFWDTQTSGQATSDGGTGLTTAQMQTAATFFEWGICGNEGIWAINEGKDYPRLGWENRPGIVLAFRLSDFLSGDGTQDSAYLIHTAEDLSTIAKFPCEHDKHFRVAFLTGEGTQESPYLIEDAEQIHLLNLCPYERDAHFRLGFVTGEGTEDNPYLIQTADEINLLRVCPYEQDAHFRLRFVTGEGTEENPYLIYTSDEISLLRTCPYEQEARFRLGFVTGEGTQDSPYLIYTADELNLVGMCPYERDAHFKLMADIDLSAFDGKDGRPAFNIVGGAYPMWFEDGEDDKPFSGVFDGDGYTISNFSYTCTETYNIGLFGYVSGPNSVIENLKLTWPNIDGGEGGNVGALVGYLESGTVANCHVEGGSVSGGWQIGGLVGASYQGKITDCNSTATVSGNDSVGGLVGRNGWQSVMTQCSSTGTVSGGSSVAGLVGSNQGTITYCDSAGRVLGDYSVGGLVGTSGCFEDWWWCEEPGTIYDSYSTAGVLGTSSNCGGLVGSNDAGEVARCYASGIVLGVSTVGGVAGWNGGKISSCYSTADVGGEKDVGGLVGLNSGGWRSPEATIANCYSTGIVLGDEYVGGLVGDGDVNGVVASFWDIETSGQGMSAGGTGKTTAEMQMASTFVNAGLPAAVGWDFLGESQNGTEDIWAICEGVDYPHLAWEFVIGDFDADADTDLADFCILAEHWFAADGSFWCGQGCDLTNDGSVNWQDLTVFAQNWLTPIAP